MQPLVAFEQVLQDAEAHRPVKALLSGSERCLTLLYTCASEPHVVAIQVHPPHTFGESEENEVKEWHFHAKKMKPTSSQGFDDRTLPPDVHNLSFLTRVEPEDKKNHFKYPLIASEETYWVIDRTETHGKCRNHYLCQGSPSPTTNHGDPGWRAFFSKVDKEILKELDGSSHWPAPGEDVKAQVRSYAD